MNSVLFVLGFLVVSGAAAEPIRGCYFTNWAQYRPGIGQWNNTRDYVKGLCTHIFWAFAYVNDTTFAAYSTEPSDLDAGGSFEQLRQLKKQQPGLKTVLSYGGYTFGTPIFESAASSEANRKLFAKNVVSFARQHGFDGADIDWEYPTADYKTNFTALLKAVKAEGGKKFLVTAATPAGIWNLKNGYDLPGINKVVDFLNVMTYDYHGSWEQQTGILSPMYSSDGLDVNSTIQYYLEQGFCPKKMVLGIPTYGRGWTLNSTAPNQQIGAPASGVSAGLPITQEPGVLAYYEACEILENGATNTWSTQAQAPFMQQDDQWYTYENTKSVGIKVSYAKENKLAGCFVWTIDFDDFTASCAAGTKYPLLNTIAKLLTGKTYQ